MSNLYSQLWYSTWMIDVESDHIIFMYFFKYLYCTWSRHWNIMDSRNLSSRDRRSCLDYLWHGKPSRKHIIRYDTDAVILDILILTSEYKRKNSPVDIQITWDFFYKRVRFSYIRCSLYDIFSAVINCHNCSVRLHFCKRSMGTCQYKHLHLKCSTSGICHVHVINISASYVVSWVEAITIECSVLPNGSLFCWSTQYCVLWRIWRGIRRWFIGCIVYKMVDNKHHSFVPIILQKMNIVWPAQRIHNHW